MSVTVTPELFAKLVGHTDERTLLFEVSDALLEQQLREGWSDPVRFRFVRTEGGLVSLEMRRE
jgi:hypothetical protein